MPGIYKKKYVSRRSTKTTRKATAKPSKSFVRKVQKIIQKDVETKDQSFVYALTPFNSGVNSAGDILRVLPQITIGVPNGARIGDQVKAQSLNIQGHMLINVVPTAGGSVPSTAIPSNCRLMVRAFIFSVKRFQNYDDAVSAQAAWAPQFLKNGSAVQGLDGTIQSMYLPVNTDVITVHKEIKKYITVESTSTVGVGTGVTGLDFQDSVKFFGANLKCKKILKYDAANFSPQNYAPLMCLSYCHLDGSAPDVLTTTISMSFVSTLKYEDA